MDGAKTEDNKDNKDEKEINNNEIPEKENKNNEMEIEENIELNNNNNDENLEKEKLKQDNIIKKEIYRTRLPLINQTSCRNVNNYRIIEDHIGEGTFGMVFKAEYIGDSEYASKNGIPKKVA